MNKDLEALEDIILYLNASEPKCLYCKNIETIQQDLLELQSIKEANPSEALEAFGRITLHTEYDNDSHYDGLHFEDDCKLVDKALERLEQIDNANPIEALECLECLYCNPEDYRGNDRVKDYETIKQALLKAEKDEKIILGIEDYLNQRIKVEPLGDVRKAFIEIRNQLQVIKKVLE